MADSVSGWLSYGQCDTERDHFPLENWRFLQIISYCLLISVLSMTRLSSGPASNQIQWAAEVAVWVLCSRGLVFSVCLLGEAIYQHVVFRQSQAHALLSLSLSSQSLPGSPYCSSSEIPYYNCLLSIACFKLTGLIAARNSRDFCSRD